MLVEVFLDCVQLIEEQMINGDCLLVDRSSDRFAGREVNEVMKDFDSLFDCFDSFECRIENVLDHQFEIFDSRTETIEVFVPGSSLEIKMKNEK